MKKEISEATPRLSVSALAGKLDMPERTLNTVLRASGFSSTGGYDVFEASRAAIGYFKSEMARLDSDAAKDRARKLKAEANAAEMDEGKMTRTLCDRDDYRNNYADAVAQGVRNIMRIKELPAVLREKVFAAIRDVKLPEPSEDK